MQGNIFRLYIIKIAKWFSLIMPIVVLFYNDNGLGQQDIFTLQAIYSVAIVILEIPSGYFADVLGRKKTLVFGAIFGFLGFLTYSFSYGFWGFMIAELILGVGQSLISGADSAMLYDTLQDQKREKEYLKYEGRITSFGNFAEAVAGICGGLLILISYRMPYFIQTGVAFLAIPAALTLIEPLREKAIQKAKLNDILQIFNYALIKNPRLRYNIIFSAIIGSATLSMAWFVQPYFIEINLPEFTFGIFWALLNLSVGLTSLIAYKVEKRLSKATIVLSITFFISLSYWLLGHFQAYWAISILFFFYLIRGFATPILKDYINKMTDSSVRATVLSVRSFIIRIVFAGLGPLLGWYTDTYSLAAALSFAGVFFIVSGTFISILLIKANK